MEAFAKHSSQAGVLERVRDDVSKHLATERYLLVAARGQIKVTEDSDMFAGVVTD